MAQQQDKHILLALIPLRQHTALQQDTASALIPLRQGTAQ